MINDLREKNILIDGEKYFVEILKYDVSPDSQDKSYSSYAAMQDIF